MKNDLCAVIVCYEPQSLIFELISALKLQNVLPIVIDNSEKDFLDFSQVDCIYHKIGRNLGIAQAQNIGIDVALSYRADAIIFFDQDSSISNRLIASLYYPIRKNKTAISVPIYCNAEQGFFYQIVRANQYGFRQKIIPNAEMSNFKTNIAISSGSMIRADLFERVGRMDEKLFIDHVDTEWFLRAASKGFEALVVTNAVMKHSIGDKVIHFFGIKVPVHSPLRRYYRVRNSFKLMGYGHVPKLLALREITFSFIHHIIILFSCPNKYSYHLFFCKAIKDVLLGKNGKISL